MFGFKVLEDLNPISFYRGLKGQFFYQTIVYRRTKAWEYAWTEMKQEPRNVLDFTKQLQTSCIGVEFIEGNYSRWPARYGKTMIKWLASSTGMTSIRFCEMIRRGVLSFYGDMQTLTHAHCAEALIRIGVWIVSV